jgi:MFS family permease
VPSDRIDAAEASKISSVTWRDVPASVWTLGFVSLLMDISSELIHSLLPLFLVTVVGASTTTVGLIEGIAEATAAISKIFSGALSDRIGQRKLLVGIGYGLSAITKPVFPLASTAWEVLAARFVDRVGKGIRDAPRDALIADITPLAIRGSAACSLASASGVFIWAFRKGCCRHSSPILRLRPCAARLSASSIS